MTISIIAAIGRNRELGKDNKLLWHIPEDLKRFKKLTQDHAVIMGRKTFESLGKPLPNRINIIITRDKNYKIKTFDVSKHRTHIVHSLEDAFKNLESKIQSSELPEEIFIIGGGEIYRQALPYADKLYLTIVDIDRPDAHTYFPEYERVFKKTIFEQKNNINGYKFTFLVLIK